MGETREQRIANVRNQATRAGEAGFGVIVGSIVGAELGLWWGVGVGVVYLTLAIVMIEMLRRAKREWEMTE